MNETSIHDLPNDNTNNKDLVSEIISEFSNEKKIENNSKENLIPNTNSLINTSENKPKVIEKINNDNLNKNIEIPSENDKKKLIKDVLITSLIFILLSNHKIFNFISNISNKIYQSEFIAILFQVIIFALVYYSYKNYL
jgi:hypothetical protein